jgi:type I restriction enzyme S subunit
MRWQAYPAYKDSGIEWLGEIPKEWEVKRLRFVCELNPKKSEIANLASNLEVSFLPMEKVGEDGSFTLDETRTLDQVRQGYTYFRDHDVVVAKITPCFENGKGTMFTGLLNGVGFGTTEFHVLRAQHSIHPRFVFYVTRSHPFRHLGTAMMTGAAGQKRVPEDFLKDFTVGFPSFSEQHAIAAVLDRKTAHIDALIAKKERQIELLQEKRAALISHAVTKGLSTLSDTAPVEKWTEARLGRFIKLQRGFDITGASECDGPFPVFSSGGLSGHSEIAMVKGPGVVIGRKGTLGTVHYSATDFWPHDTTLWVKEFQGNFPRFVYYFLIHLKLENLDVGSANPTLNRNHVHPTPVRFPDPKSQIRISAYLDKESFRTDKLTDRITESVTKLHEYRTALISAAVTGKIDVRNVGQQEATE